MNTVDCRIVKPARVWFFLLALSLWEPQFAQPVNARPVKAQPEENVYSQPQISPIGNYLTNAGPVKGTVTGHATAGALWRVMTPQLNCRQGPSPKARVILSFRHGAVLQADLGRGGSDEVLYNARDARGYTWMLVRSRQGQPYHCYVRAHQRFIRPLDA